MKFNLLEKLKRWNRPAGLIALAGLATGCAPQYEEWQDYIDKDKGQDYFEYNERAEYDSIDTNGDVYHVLKIISVRNDEGDTLYEVYKYDPVTAKRVKELLEMNEEFDQMEKEMLKEMRR